MSPYDWSYMQNDMKKISNRMSVKQSSTKEGQRELLREHTNKINEIIEELNMKQTLTQRVKRLESKVLELSKRAVLKPTEDEALKQMKREMGYTAQASTGDHVAYVSKMVDGAYCECEKPIQCSKLGCVNVLYNHCAICERLVTSKQTTPVCCHCEKDVNKPLTDSKPNKELREVIADCIIGDWRYMGVERSSALELADKILKLLNN